MDNVYTDFVEKIANENPIEPLGEINICRFCGKSWVEDTYDEYLENAETLRNDPNARSPKGIGHRIAWQHHNSDCLWVEANELLRR